MKPSDANGLFSKELSSLLRAGFDAIQPFYLEFPQLNSGCSDAILNMLMLNYDQFLELDSKDSSSESCVKIRSTERQIVKEATAGPAYVEGQVISDDMRLFSIDIIFKKK